MSDRPEVWLRGLQPSTVLGLLAHAAEVPGLAGTCRDQLREQLPEEVRAIDPCAKSTTGRNGQREL